VLVKLGMMAEDFGEQSSTGRMPGDERMVELGRRTLSPAGAACRPC